MRSLKIAGIIFLLSALPALAGENPWKNHYAEKAADISKNSVHEITYGNIKTAVADALMAQGAGENLQVNIPRPDSQIILSQTESIEMELADLEFDEGFKTFTATAHFSAGGKPLAPMKLSGSYDEVMEVAVLKRRLMQSDVITENDIIIQKLPAKRLHPDVLGDAKELIGKSPKRTISAMRPIRRDEVVNPPVIMKGDKIALMYHSGSMEIKTLGEALENGAGGDSIRVRNIDSHMVIQAEVLREGVAEVFAGEKSKI